MNCVYTQALARMVWCRKQSRSRTASKGGDTLSLCGSAGGLSYHLDKELDKPRALSLNCWLAAALPSGYFDPTGQAAYSLWHPRCPSRFILSSCCIWILSTAQFPAASGNNQHCARSGSSSSISVYLRHTLWQHYYSSETFSTALCLP